MDCKTALAECNADLDLAFQWLREKGIAKAQKKSTRDANEGLVSIMSNDNGTVIVEINSETDFVSRNKDFHALVKKITQIVLNAKSNIDSVKVEIDGIISDLKGFVNGCKLDLTRAWWSFSTGNYDTDNSNDCIIEFKG